MAPDRNTNVCFPRHKVSFIQCESGVWFSINVVKTCTGHADSSHQGQTRRNESDGNKGKTSESGVGKRDIKLHGLIATLFAYIKKWRIRICLVGSLHCSERSYVLSHRNIQCISTVGLERSYQTLLKGRLARFPSTEIHWDITIRKKIV